MSYIQGVVSIVKITIGGMCDFTLLAPELAGRAHAGQFCHVRVPGFFLRRPISICQVNRAEGTVRLLFGIQGEGTMRLAMCAPREELDVMGPLGNGFTLLSPDSHAVVVGGGIGVPPLLETAAHYGKNACALLGFRGREHLVLTRDFEALGAETMVATDDGSYGFHGLVTALLERRLEREPADIVYACGPRGMLRGVAELCAQRGVRCQVSLEERMACGVGACLGCACKVKRENGQGDTPYAYAHVCKNGPVFEAAEVVWDE